jgi:type IV pilus assembly protein PilC
VSSTRAGETSGNLKGSIEHIADNIEKNYNLTSRVKGALIYPAVVLIVFAIVGFLVMAFIVPKLMQMIKELGVEVPWYTKALILASDFMASYWWAILIIVTGAVIALVYYIRTDEGRKGWDEMKIKIPKFGSIYKGVYMTRFSENLSVLLASGIPIIKALTVVSAVVGNHVYEKIILSAAEEVRTGGNMSTALKKYPQFPPIVTQMIKIGEESGKTDEILGEVAKFYEQETDTVTKNLTTLIEPILIVVMGVAVGVLAVSVILPIYDVASKIQ